MVMEDKAIVKSYQRYARAKRPTGRFYNGNSLLGNDWAIFYFLIGSGDIGKSYWAMHHVLSAKYRNPDKYKLYWTRLTDNACKRLLADNAKNLIDPDLYRKFGYDIRQKGGTVYYGHYVNHVTKSGKIQVNFEKIGELCNVLPLSTFFNNKGEALFDKDFKGEYYIILDEMNREAGEANRFDIVEAFANQLENFCRDTKCKVRVICIGNNTDECSDILSAFEFIPRSFGRFKLKRKKAIIDVIEPSAQYYEDRKNSVGYLLNPNAKRFTTVNEIDDSLIAPNQVVRTKKPYYILKFDKPESTWFVLNSGNLITKYNKEKCNAMAMKKYINDTYNLNFVNTICDTFNAQGYYYDSYATRISFSKWLSRIKK